MFSVCSSIARSATEGRFDIALYKHKIFNTKWKITEDEKCPIGGGGKSPYWDLCIRFIDKRKPRSIYALNRTKRIVVVRVWNKRFVTSPKRKKTYYEHLTVIIIRNIFDGKIKLLLKMFGSSRLATQSSIAE
jgi:hypothetical protein